MIIEGRNAVLEALKSDTAMDKLLIEKGAELKGSGGSLFRLARDKRVKYQFAPRAVLDKESPSGRHQGFLAYVSEFDYCQTEDILDYAASRGEEPFLVLLDGVEDPHNLGSVIRVCECAGVHGIVIPKYRSAAVNETVVRVSAGACNHMRIARTVNLNTEIENLKKRNIWVYAAEADGAPMYQTDLRGALALVIGSEGKGVKALTRELCDVVLSIPMFGQVNSLNASVACGIAVYEAVRQRTQLQS